MLETGEKRGATLEKPALIVVVEGILRVSLEDSRLELGPCAMLYVPLGSRVVFEAPWSRVEARILESFDLGPKPRILNHTYAIKTPSGEAALCLHITEEGTKILVNAYAYPVRGKVVALTNGSERVLAKGERITPPVVVKPLDAKRASLLLLTSK